ncbi:MAG: TfoX/Sxy family protein [Rhodospirillales bacterium]|nr:TfoX/Sxy family protein [Rhodospirillales bacterium]
MTQYLRNLGPASWRMLARAGIPNTEALRKAGAVRAYISVQESGGQASLNFLYAMAAGLDGRDWRDLSALEKGRLNREVEDLLESLGANPNASPDTGS